MQPTRIEVIGPSACQAAFAVRLDPVVQRHICYAEACAHRRYAPPGLNQSDRFQLELERVLGPLYLGAGPVEGTG